MFCFYEAKAEGLREEKIPGNLREYRRSGGSKEISGMQIIGTVGLHGAVVTTHNQKDPHISGSVLPSVAPVFSGK